MVWRATKTEYAHAQPQGATAELTGQVTDETGAVIRGVQLTLQNKSRGVLPKGSRSAEGYYRFSFLSPGNYILTVESDGFATISIPVITLEVHQTAKVNVTMKPGTLVQQVSGSVTPC
jgi:hypothetical protein